MKGSYGVMVFSFCAFGFIARTFHNHCPKTLLAAVDAFPAQRIVCNPVSMVEKQGPFHLAFFAYSWHGNASFPTISVI